MDQNPRDWTSVWFLFKRSEPGLGLHYRQPEWGNVPQFFSWILSVQYVSRGDRLDGHTLHSGMSGFLMCIVLEEQEYPKQKLMS